MHGTHGLYMEKTFMAKEKKKHRKDITFILMLALKMNCIFIDYLRILWVLQTMTSFMPPPPAATSLAFHPQDNNIIAIGLADSTICIYDVRVDGVCLLLLGIDVCNFMW